MLNLTDDMARRGWMYRVGGFRNRHSGFTVVRKIDWDSPDSEPEWWVQDMHGNVIATFADVSDAMDTAEATHELQLQNV